MERVRLAAGWTGTQLRFCSSGEQASQPVRNPIPSANSTQYQSIDNR